MAAFSHLYVWRDRPLLELVEHIAQAYHEPHREQLARLCEITHELRGEAPFTGGIPGLVEAFEYLREELLQHMLKEERHIFSRAVGGGVGWVSAAPMKIAEHEHELMGTFFEQLRDLTDDYGPAADASPALRAFCTGLSDMDALYREHTWVEEQILMPRIRNEA